MKHYAGIDVSLNGSSVCVVDANGKIVRKDRSQRQGRERASGSDRMVSVAWREVGADRAGGGTAIAMVIRALHENGLAVELLETRRVKAALSEMPVETDRNDARGLAQLMRLVWFRPVHCKSMVAQEVRAADGA